MASGDTIDFRDALTESAGFKVTQTQVLHWNVFEQNYLPKVDVKMFQRLSLWSLTVNLLTQKNLCPKLLLSRTVYYFRIKVGGLFLDFLTAGQSSHMLTQVNVTCIIK